MSLRRTKILATMGPASDDPIVLEKMLKNGVDVLRLNFSHSSHKEQQKRVELIRKIAEKVGKEVAILADLQGPKIRVAKFAEGRIDLEDGQSFMLDAAFEGLGDDTKVGIDYKALPTDVEPGDRLLLDDGRIELRVERVEGTQIHTTVVNGGILSNHKGINRFGGGLSAKALTEKDQADLLFVAQAGVDYIAISFPRSAEDMLIARRCIEKANVNVRLIAKIERAEAVINLGEILDVSDGVMVARGDLGVEIGDAELPGVQKNIIRMAREKDSLVITATQMMETMIESTIPTRAEVFDVANAVLDGTDAVMLSAETAVGRHPHKVIEAMDRICLAAERDKSTQVSTHRLSGIFERVDEAIAMSAMYCANHLSVRAIICFTESGATPLWMSRINSAIPIFGFSRHLSTIRAMTLYRGVIPVLFEPMVDDSDVIAEEAIKVLKQRGTLQSGERIIMTRGDIMGEDGGTNRMKIMIVK